MHPSEQTLDRRTDTTSRSVHGTSNGGRLACHTDSSRVSSHVVPISIATITSIIPGAAPPRNRNRDFVNATLGANAHCPLVLLATLARLKPHRYADLFSIL